MHFILKLQKSLYPAFKALERYVHCALQLGVTRSVAGLAGVQVSEVRPVAYAPVKRIISNNSYAYAT